MLQSSINRCKFLSLQVLASHFATHVEDFDDVVLKRGIHCLAFSWCLMPHALTSWIVLK